MMRSRSIRPLALALALALVSILLSGASPKNADAKDASQKPAGPSVLVQLAPLRRGSLPHVITAYGTVTPTAGARRLVAAPLSATVAALYVHQGEKIAKDAALLRLVPSPAACATYAEAESAFRLARQLAARTQALTRQHLATEQELSKAEKSEADAKATLAALTAEGANGPAILRSPFPAIVTRLSVSPGALVQRGETLLDLAPPGRLVLNAGVVPTHAPAVHVGDRVWLTPLGGGSRFSGTVRLRGAIVEPGSGLVPVEISLPPGKALPGEMLRADIATGEARGYLVPHSAILVDDRGHPYVVQAVGGVARIIPVQVLSSRGDEDVIDGKLDPRAPVVLAGNHQLRSGMRVRVADPERERRR